MWCSDFEFEFEVLSKLFAYIKPFIVFQGDGNNTELAEFLEIDSINTVDYTLYDQCIGGLKVDNRYVFFDYVSKVSDILALEKRIKAMKEYYDESDIEFVMLTRESMNKSFFSKISEKKLLKTIQDFYLFACKIIPYTFATNPKTIIALGSVSELLKD